MTKSPLGSGQMENTQAREALLKELKSYRGFSDDESGFKNRFLELLQHEDAFHRTHLPGHITGSAFIVSKDFRQTLLVHHVKLNKWLQPGGHADGDTNVARVALREANEETGLHNLALVTPAIFDLDIHPIPARKDFQQHDHYDIRFLIQASTAEATSVSEESHDVKWVPLAELEKFNGEKSILRLREKLMALYPNKAQ